MKRVLTPYNPENKISKQAIENIYIGLNKITEPVAPPPAFSERISVEMKQALLAASPWFLFCIFFLPGLFKGNKEAPSIIGGSLFIAFLVGFGGYLIPTEWGSGIRYVIYPLVVNLIIFILLVLKGRKKKS